ncbi:hypothetical protein D9619_004042 [Psilocybe cf. subviscida]|uniref:Uncharacterized protein n=1 Tax=Psilocybe cf. subviscida TaxID=2480587 RepID=A0A8H5BQN4_9AGAR|nr:hypothetical protein D9619_004042 [Psilocybe cf. subviscida]
MSGKWSVVPRVLFDGLARPPACSHVCTCPFLRAEFAASLLSTFVETGRGARRLRPSPDNVGKPAKRAAQKAEDGGLLDAIVGAEVDEEDGDTWPFLIKVLNIGEAVPTYICWARTRALNRRLWATWRHETINVSIPSELNQCESACFPCTSSSTSTLMQKGPQQKVDDAQICTDCPADLEYTKKRFQAPYMLSEVGIPCLILGGDALTLVFWVCTVGAILHIVVVDKLIDQAFDPIIQKLGYKTTNPMPLLVPQPRPPPGSSFAPDLHGFVCHSSRRPPPLHHHGPPSALP